MELFYEKGSVIMVEPRDGRSLDIVTFNSGDEVIEVLHVHGNTDCEFLLSDSNRKWTVDNRATLSFRS